MNRYALLLLFLCSGCSFTKQPDKYYDAVLEYDYPMEYSYELQKNDAIYYIPQEDRSYSERKESEITEAEQSPSPHTFTGSISFLTDYRFRGISQTMKRPAIQGGFLYSHSSGFYLGTVGTNISGIEYNNASMEWDFFGGFKEKPFTCSLPDFGYDVGIYCYTYPSGKVKNSHNTRYNTAEFYIGLSYKWLSIKYSQSITNYFGIQSENTPFNWHTGRYNHSNGSSRGSNYIQANISYDLIDNMNLCDFEFGKLNLALHVGHITVRHYSHLSYTDWSATLTQGFKWVDVFVTYVGTNANTDYYDVPDNGYHSRKHSLGAQGVVFGVTKSF